ncbi:hypothetical protein [Gracilibacillus alcaliphilus]|uniref:hypothetical protein n=1 Tax=Gracilibacillus alcaliphilus TaxID=1401441 RepID=UPI00195B922B|nr:hypothetical protein [Gracilibacillus alcaliphilus]MBM7677399.1 hypothetical protein [Gracilibacillus alcaliphilus]
MDKDNYQQTVNEETTDRKEQTEKNTAGQEGQQADGQEKKKIGNFDFAESMKEAQGIALDAVLRPHKVVASNRSIKIETSGIILAVLALLISISSFLFYKYGFDGLLSYFEDVGFTFALKTFFAWIITFAVGYFSIYLLLKHFGNRDMAHKELLTKYAIVSIPFALVFCLVILFFGFVMVDLFVITYVFALMLYGLMHIYLFLVHMRKSKFDLYWTMMGYLLFLIVVTYLLNGMDFSSF